MPLSQRFGRLWVPALTALLAFCAVWVLLLAPMVRAAQSGFGNDTGQRELSGVEKQNIVDAEKTDAGKLLVKEGYRGTFPLSDIDDRNTVKFLNAQQTRVHTNGIGPYVRFAYVGPQAATPSSSPSPSTTPTPTPLPSKPTTAVKPDVLVDVRTGMIVGLYQEFASRRTLTCFNDRDLRTLTPQWAILQQAVWNRNSADVTYALTNADSDQIPKGQTFHCFAHKKS